MNINGMIVKSNQGRDLNNIYLVKDVKDGYAYLVDGRKRKLNNPKAKNIKHITILNNNHNEYQYDCDVINIINKYKNYIYGG